MKGKFFARNKNFINILNITILFDYLLSYFKQLRDFTFKQILICFDEKRLDILVNSEI